VILNEVFVFLDAFEMKGRETILWVSWAAKKINEWALNKAGVKREFLYRESSILRSHHEETAWRKR